jgi:hypothetical protein
MSGERPLVRSPARVVVKVGGVRVFRLSGFQWIAVLGSRGEVGGGGGLTVVVVRLATEARRCGSIADWPGLIPDGRCPAAGRGEGREGR